MTGNDEIPMFLDRITARLVQGGHEIKVAGNGGLIQDAESDPTLDLASKGYLPLPVT